VDVFESLSRPILAAFPELAPEDLIFAPPPKLDMGDVALRTFEPARKLKMPPPQLAARIANDVKFGDDVAGVSVAGPYANFKLNRNTFGRRIAEAVLREGGRFGSNGTGAGRKALVEHTSINPNASPHVGRGRGAMIGDSVVRLLRFEEYDVEVHYYVNDIGRQIALLVLACEDGEALGFDDMLAVYQAANERAEADPEFAAEAYALLAHIEEGDADTLQRFRTVTDLCLKGQLAILARLGATYDVFDRESNYVKDPRLDRVVEALRARDAVFTDEEGRLSVDLSKLGYEYEEGRYMALLRSNGSSLYAYRDMAYTMDKMERTTDLNLIVLGEDHKLYTQQVTLVLDAAGERVPEPIYYSHITLKEGKMSTRQGRVVLLSEFLDEARDRAREKVEDQCKDLSPDERAAIAEKVAVAAIRFAILRVGPAKNVVFDWESSLSFTGDTGPYVQYSCARISSILRKYGDLSTDVSDEFPIETDAEWALLMKLAGFRETVLSALRQRNCAPVAQFALDTARLFTTFYHECPVLEAPTPAQRVARAQICAATRQAVQNALGLLGVEALERM
jgi:arginyl-tRNA synthetase